MDGVATALTVHLWPLERSLLNIGVAVGKTVVLTWDIPSLKCLCTRS